MTNRFLIITHVQHKFYEGRYYAYAPYVREMNIWLKHVGEVEVIAPKAPRPPKGEKPPGPQRLSFIGKAYEHPDLRFTKIPFFHLLNFSGRLEALYKIPIIFFRIFIAMRRADHLHMRCPGNVGLLACMCQIFFPSKPKSAKYAGNWDPQANQPWTYRLQKWILNNTFLTCNMQVLVYGGWPGQSKNVMPFFTASFSEEEKAQVPKKAFSAPFKFLFVGNLVEGKRPLEAVKLVEAINAAVIDDKNREIFASLDIYGDGPERQELEDYVADNKLEGVVVFNGSRPLEELKEAYQKAHFVILPSKSEGWPKAIAEGMFYGCISIATPVSCVPWMLGAPPAPEGGAKKTTLAERGILLNERLLDTFQKSRQFECPDEYRDVSRTSFSETLEVTEDEWAVDSDQWSLPAGAGEERKNQEPGTNPPSLKLRGAGNQDGKKEWAVGSGQWSEDVKKIIGLMEDPKKMEWMSEEAKKWSQQYTLEKFEKAIKKVLLYPNEEINVSNRKLSPAPFRACPDSSGDGVKRGKNEK